MFCTKCGKENKDQADYCAFCGALLVRPGEVTPAPRTSGMAVASLVLGILGIFSAGLLAIPGLVFGIIALNRINRNRGRLRGQGLAIAGISVSAVVLALLPAIMAPVFLRARAAAKRAECLSNMKQIALATLMYAQDWDEVLPLAESWSDGLTPYTKNREIFVCPARRGAKCGYAYNEALHALPLVYFSEFSESVAARTVMFLESDLGWNGSGSADALPAAPRHMDSDNFAFCDGHVQVLRRAAQSEVLWQVRRE